MKTPKELNPVLANIGHQYDLGYSEWYEVVYYRNGWESYNGSDTFENGEQVNKWVYVKDCFV